VAEERNDDQVPAKLATGELEPLQEGDVLFRIQMRIADAFFEHWKRGLVLLLAVLFLVLTVGTWKNRMRDAQRDTTASIAAIDRKMPEVDQLAAMGLAPLDDLNDPARVQLLEAIARKYEEVGAAGTKASAAEAWLKGGDTWDRLGRPEEAARAYQGALDAFTMGPFGHTATNALAAVRVAQGDTEGAATLYRSIVANSDDYLAERAQYDLASVLEVGGDTAGAVAAYKDFQTRYPDSSLGVTVREDLRALSGATPQPSTAVEPTVVDEPIVVDEPTPAPE
jgi:tetratricopeptide (TPR) repeat protein